ncbi:hypothetical protein ACSBR2_026864 [Camellia fascicularis]
MSDQDQSHEGDPVLVDGQSSQFLVLVDDSISKPLNDGEESPTTRRTTSMIDGKDKAKCNYCKKLYLGESRQGSSHLREHFKKCPKRIFKDIGDLRQQILVKEQKKADGKVSLNPYHFDQDISRKELANMVILHEYPLTMVEHIGFKKFVTSLQPSFKMISRNTLKRDILKIYDHENGRL